MLIRRTAAALLLTTLLTGCAGRSGTAPAGGPGSPGTPPSAVATAGPSAGLPVAAGGETLTGTVAAGVEPGCLVLKNSGDQHLLVFDDPALKAAAQVGARITVVGRAEPGLASTCQQGTPFIVTSLRAG